MILLDENSIYFLGKNIKRNSYRSIKAATLVSIRVSSYEDIIKAQKQRDFREARVKAGQRQWHSKRYQSIPAQVIEEILSG
jgi:hypothetical protein